MCTSNHDDILTTYDKYTAGVLPVNSADSTTHFYSYQKENVHIIACDAYFTDATTMQNWLDQELANVPADDWLIGFWHPPCYGDITYKSSYLDRCAPWLEKFHARGGDFVFHGHAHVYVRTHPLSPDGTVNNESGMVHIVNGCGGASWKDPQPYTNKTAYTPDTTSFATITFITIEGDTARLQTIDARPGRNLAVIDEFVWPSTTTAVPEESAPPTDFRLGQNYPNPFNSTTMIRFSLPARSYMTLKVHDITGKVVSTLIDGFQGAGTYTVELNALDSKGQELSSGIYFYQVLSGSFTKTRKMVLLR